MAIAITDNGDDGASTDHLQIFDDGEKHNYRESDIKIFTSIPGANSFLVVELLDGQELGTAVTRTFYSILGFDWSSIHLDTQEFP